jgi:ABC-type cobalt transport system substrate-binding protein
VAFTAVEYFPVSQSVHTAAPVDVLYFPATQSAHVPPFGPVEPALQVQLVKAALPASELEADGQARHVELASAPTVVEYVPDPQSVHTADPVNVLYFPATHAVHVPPFGPVEPALQVQFVKAWLPVGELEADGQATHVELASAATAVEYFPVSQSVHTDAPVDAEYVPAAQSSHATDPVDALYFPATQSVHVPPSGPVEPALQVQLVKAALPAGELEADGQALHVAAFAPAEYVPAVQSLHSSDPVDALYFPARQSVHVPPFGPVEPALQVQLVKAGLPSGELVSADGQVTHVEIASAPTASEYVPAPQFVH